MTYPTDIHGPAATAPTVSGKVAHCQVCGVQWQVRGDGPEACNFCGAPENAVTIVSEEHT